MKSSINLSGQWVGYFTYGPEYGEEMHGERVQFRLFISDFSDGQFKGTSVDVEGYGANMDTAVINGFLTDNFISFTKEYQEYLIIESDGQITKDQSAFKPRLSYQGYYNFRSNIFEGQWELLANEELAPDGSIVDLYTGTWEMLKDHD